MRISKKAVRSMFIRLLKSTGKSETPLWINDGRDNLVKEIGGWSLDYAPIYGGYVIEQEEENGGISHPFGFVRRSAREMYLSLQMTVKALEMIKYKEENKHE